MYIMQYKYSTRDSNEYVCWSEEKNACGGLPLQKKTEKVCALLLSLPLLPFSSRNTSASISAFYMIFNEKAFYYH